MGGRIQGLEELPPCWLAGLAQWLRKNPSLAAVIVRVSVRSGVLWPQLDEPSRYWGDGPLAVPEAINLFVYPSLWRPLLQRHLAQLMVERPTCVRNFNLCHWWHSNLKAFEKRHRPWSVL